MTIKKVQGGQQDHRRPPQLLSAIKDASSLAFKTLYLFSAEATP